MILLYAAPGVPRRGESPVMCASAVQVAAPPGEVVSSTGKGKYISAQVTLLCDLRSFLYLFVAEEKYKCYMENKSFHSVYRGDIFYADLEPVIGSEQGGVRPVLVIQNDIGNRHSPTVIVAAITSRIKHRRQPTHVNLNRRQCGLHSDSTIMLEQLRTLDKQRLLGYVGSVGKAKMDEVDSALEISVGTSKKPLPP